MGSETTEKQLTARQIYKRNWRLQNMDKSRAYSRKYKEKNRERVRESEKKYYQRPEIQERVKAYRRTPEHRKRNTINSWKHLGIDCNGEWEEVWEWYSTATRCGICDVEFTELYSERTRATRNLDHDHNLDGYNVRGVICITCNVNEDK